MQEVGTLVVVVLKAQNLPDKHSLYKQDVFAQAVFQGNTKTTSVDVKGGQHPMWDEELRFPIYQKKSGEDRILDVSCWRKEPRSSESIGKGSVNLEETLRTGEFDDWVRLEENDTYRGDLYLEMTFFAAGPAPLQRRVTKMPASERHVRTTQAYQYPNLPQGRSALQGQAPRTSTSSSRGPPAQTSSPNTTTAQTAAAGATLSAHSTAHTSPRVSRSKTDALPPIPQDRIPANSIPDILRPGNPKGDIHYSDKPHPRQPSVSQTQTRPPPSHPPIPPTYGACTTASVPPHTYSQSPPRVPTGLPSQRNSSASFSVPPTLRVGPSPSRDVRSTSSSLPGPAHNMLPPQNPIHAQYPVTSRRSPSPPLLPLPGLPGAQEARMTPSVYISAQPPAPHEYSAVPPALRNNLPQPYYRPTNQYSAPPTETRPAFPVPSLPVPTRYAGPLPLPDEPEGVQTPTPKHPEPHISTTTHSRDQGPSRDTIAKSVQERDKLVALELEREEEARRREAEERERADEELAKKLDLELNLDDGGCDGAKVQDAESVDKAPGQTHPSRAGSGSDSMQLPGAW